MTRSDAYVLVQTDGRTAPIARSLQDLPGIVFAEDVQGPYDAVVLARPDGLVSSVQEIVEEIRALPGVLHALAAPIASVRTEAPVLTAA